MAHLMTCFLVIYVYLSDAPPPHCGVDHYKIKVGKGWFRSDVVIFLPNLAHILDIGEGVVSDKSGHLLVPPFCRESVAAIERFRESPALEDHPRVPVLTSFDYCDFRRLSQRDAQRVGTYIADANISALEESYSDSLLVYQLHDEGPDVCFTWVSVPFVSIRMYRCHVDRRAVRFRVAYSNFATTTLDVFSSVLSSMEHIVQSLVSVLIRSVFTTVFGSVAHVVRFVLPTVSEVCHTFETLVDLLVPYGLMEVVLFVVVVAHITPLYIVCLSSLVVALVSMKLRQN